MGGNIIANFIGRFWSILSNFIFIPLYIKYLGFQNYSIISFTLVLASVMAIMDAGLTSTLSREFARNDTSLNHKRKVFRKLEHIYFLIGVSIIILIFCFSRYIALGFIKETIYTQDEVSKFLRIICFDIAFQMIFKFYIGGLLGLEKQVSANILQICWGIMRNAVVIIIIVISPKLISFFSWQAFTSLIFVLILRIILSRQLSIKQEVDYTSNKAENNHLWKFALGMFFISIVASINTQVDKLMLSKLLPIDNLGYYTIAVSLAMGLLTLISPFSIALLPRFTSLFSSGKSLEASELFIKYQGLIVIIVFSFMSSLILFSDKIIWIWTGNLDIAEKSGGYLPILAIAYSFLALQVLFYNIAIANGYTLLNNILGVLSLLITIPGYLFGIKHYGVWGAICVFCFVQTSIALIYMQQISKRFLSNISFSNLYLEKLLLPAMLTLGFTYLCSLVMMESGNRIVTLFQIGIGVLLTLFFSVKILYPDISIINFYKLNFKK